MNKSTRRDVYIFIHDRLEIKKLRIAHLGDRVIDVDGRDLQFALFQHLVQVVDTCSGLLRHATDT